MIKIKPEPVPLYDLIRQRKGCTDIDEGKKDKCFGSSLSTHTIYSDVLMAINKGRCFSLRPIATSEPVKFN